MKSENELQQDFLDTIDNLFRNAVGDYDAFFQKTGGTTQVIRGDGRPKKSFEMQVNYGGKRGFVKATYIGGGKVKVLTSPSLTSLGSKEPYEMANLTKLKIEEIISEWVSLIKLAVQKS